MPTRPVVRNGMDRRSFLGMGVGAALAPASLFAARPVLKPTPPSLDWRYPLPASVHALYAETIPLRVLSEEDRAAVVSDLSRQALLSPNGLGIALPEVVVETLRIGGARLLAPRLLVAGPEGGPSVERSVTVFSCPDGNQNVLLRVRRNRASRTGSLYAGGKPRISNDLFVNLGATEYARDDDALPPVASIALTRSAANSWLVPPLVNSLLNPQVLYVRLQTTRLNLVGPNNSGFLLVNNIAGPESSNRSYLPGGDALVAASGEGRGVSDTYVLDAPVPGLTRADLSALEILPRVTQIVSTTIGKHVANDTYVNLYRGTEPNMFLGDVVSVEWIGNTPQIIEGIGRVVFRLDYDASGVINELEYGIIPTPGLGFDFGVGPTTIIRQGEWWQPDYQGVFSEGGPTTLRVAWSELVRGAHSAYRKLPFR